VRYGTTPGSPPAGSTSGSATRRWPTRASSGRSTSCCAWGSSDDPAETAAGAFAARWERDPDNPLASIGAVVSLIPDRPALVLGLAAAGFTDVRVAEPREHHVSGFRSGDRVVVTAR